MGRVFAVVEILYRVSVEKDGEAQVLDFTLDDGGVGPSWRGR